VGYSCRRRGAFSQKGSSLFRGCRAPREHRNTTANLRGTAITSLDVSRNVIGSWRNCTGAAINDATRLFLWFIVELSSTTIVAHTHTCAPMCCSWNLKVSILSVVTDFQSITVFSILKPVLFFFSVELYFMFSRKVLRDMLARRQLARIYKRLYVLSHKKWMYHNQLFSSHLTVIGQFLMV